MCIIMFMRSTDAVLERATRFFMKTSDVHATLRDLAKRLRDARIDYAVIGGMALNLHVPFPTPEMRLRK